MPAYVIEVDDSKEGVCYPTVVGPFKNEKAAYAFAEEMQMGTAAESQGGYSAYHVISTANCNYTPKKYRAAYAWRLGEEI